jgi:hypothetical protein
MDALTLFGVAATSLMFASYCLERRSHWFILAFAAGCAMTSAYAFLSRVWIIGIIEFVWYLVAMRRWVMRVEAEIA